MDERPVPSPRPDEGPGGPDEREHAADEREAALDKREQAVQAKESAQVGREQETQGILDAADERDELADERDAAADERDKAASLHSFLRDDDYGPGYKARMSAGMDRSDSKGDRTSAADDRSRLTQDGPDRGQYSGQDPDDDGRHQHGDDQRPGDAERSEPL
jgi:hypothetical protein